MMLAAFTTSLESHLMAPIIVVLIQQSTQKYPNILTGLKGSFGRAHQHNDRTTLSGRETCLIKLDVFLAKEKIEEINHKYSQFT